MGKGIFSLILCVFCCSALISMKPGERQVFHEVVISTFLYPAHAILSRVNTTFLVMEENKGLKRQNASIRVENDFLRQAMSQFPRINELTQFSDSSGLHLVMGQISAQDPGRFLNTWVVNLGREDSVEVNMPVLTSKGVVGKIAKCYRSHSLVQLLTDPNSKISVIGNRSRVKGILESYKISELVARFPSDADIVPGDTLVTSGIGGVFPKGLRIGIVAEDADESRDMKDILRSVSIKPFQNPHLVEEVFVLRKSASWVVGEEL